MATRRTYDPANVEDTLAKLRQFYLVGQASLQDHPERIKYGTTKEHAVKLGHHPEHINKARGFATKWSEAEIEEVSRLARKHGTPFTPGHVLCTLSLTKAQRVRVVKTAIKNGWAANRLEEYVKQFKPPVDPRKGRKPALPKDADGHVIHLANTALRWKRWAAALADNAESQAAFKKVPADIKRLVDQITDSMEKLDRAVTRVRRK